MQRRKCVRYPAAPPWPSHSPPPRPRGSPKGRPPHAHLDHEHHGHVLERLKGHRQLGRAGAGAGGAAVSPTYAQCDGGAKDRCNACCRSRAAGRKERAPAHRAGRPHTVYCGTVGCLPNFTPARTHARCEHRPPSGGFAARQQLTCVSGFLGNTKRDSSAKICSPNTTTPRITACSLLVLSTWRRGRGDGQGRPREGEGTGEGEAGTAKEPEGYGRR